MLALGVVEGPPIKQEVRCVIGTVEVVEARGGDYGDVR